MHTSNHRSPSASPARTTVRPFFLHLQIVKLPVIACAFFFQFHRVSLHLPAFPYLRPLLFRPFPPPTFSILMFPPVRTCPFGFPCPVFCFASFVVRDSFLFFNFDTQLLLRIFRPPPLPPARFRVRSSPFLIFRALELFDEHHLERFPRSDALKLSNSHFAALLSQPPGPFTSDLNSSISLLCTSLVKLGFNLVSSGPPRSERNLRFLNSTYCNGFVLPWCGKSPVS